MRRVLVMLALPASLGGQVADQETGRRAEQTAITDVTVVDVERGRHLPGQTVLVDGSRIVAMGPRVRVPAGARVIDGRRRFLVPGFWDMHIHLLDRGRLTALDGGPSGFALVVANGITGVRNMHSTAPLPDIVALRRRVTQGEVLGPRMVVATQLLDGPRPLWPIALPVSDTVRARVVVDSLVDAGADLIKVYSYLPRDVYYAIAAAARRRDVPFAGHMPVAAVTAAEAVDAGQRSFEHLYGVVEGCSTAESELVAAERALIAGEPRGMATAPQVFAGWRRGFDTFDARKCAPLLARFARTGTWQDPTLTVWGAFARLQDSTYLHDPLLRYMPAQRAARAGLAQLPASVVADARASERGARRLTAALQRGGVGLLAGTDAPSFGALPGFSLHDELTVMVEAGLTPAEALRTATLNPARYLMATDSLGTVATGKLADLVLLDADPLRDIRNTRRIRGVMLNGRYLNRAALDTLLAKVEQRAK